MRSHNNEHSDSLPILDISALKHIAYVLDALIYYMRSDTINAPLQTTSVNTFNDLDSEPWVADQVELSLIENIWVVFHDLSTTVYGVTLFSCRMRMKMMKTTKR